jgi:hypothetical protein
LKSLFILLCDAKIYCANLAIFHALTPVGLMAGILTSALAGK